MHFSGWSRRQSTAWAMLPSGYVPMARLRVTPHAGSTRRKRIERETFMMARYDHLEPLQRADERALSEMS